MTDQNRLLAPYLPRLVVEWMGDEPDVSGRVLDGTVVFIDISGFTKLSEGLAQAGNIGAEELAATIGSTFTDLLAVAYSEGGRLLKFGGDALLLFFRGEEHAARGCSAAIRMRRALREQGELRVLDQRVRLRMSVGVHSGEFHFFLVGQSHRELVVTGPGITEVATLEGAATAGEILISQATASSIRPSLVGESRGPGRLLRRAPRSDATRDGDFTLRLAAEVDLARCVPTGLRTSLVAGTAPEHRRVAVAFVHFDGTDAMIRDRPLQQFARELDELVSVVEAATDRHGVTFLATDADKDGGKLILTSGAPTSSGDDERRMLLALRDIVEADTTIPVRVGVNRGAVFAGDIGPAYRRTYTVMGDAVNLAARLMAHAAPGEILATHEIVDRSPTAFSLDPVEPFFVKGKSAPVEAWRVGPVVGAKPDLAPIALPFTGRDREMGMLEAALDGARAGEGRMIDVCGAAGMGKSRLLGELRTRSIGVRELTARCELYEATTPYYPFRAILRPLLGLDPLRLSESDTEQLVATLAERAPELLPWAPLVGIAADVAVAETRESEQIEDQFRAARLGAVVGDLLARFLAGPTLLMIEDTQWIDDASAELLRALRPVVEDQPWVVVTTRRDDAPGLFEPEISTPDLVLEPLSFEDASALIRDATLDAPISDHDIERLAERSAGNPMFLAALVAAARAAGGIATLPDSVDALVAATIDRLPPQDRDLLRRLAVLGRTFSEDLVPAVLDDDVGLDEAAWARVAEYLVADGPGRWAFEHAVVQDCAYEGLAYRARRSLHARVGDALRSRTATDADEPVELLSLHYLRAERFAEAFDYSRTAADQAREVFADHEASELYERALAAARRLDDVPTEVHAQLREHLGDVRHRSGRFTDADKAFRAARRYVVDDPVAQARLQLKRAWIKGWNDRYSEALRTITRGLGLLDGTDDADALRQRAQLLAWYSQFSLAGGSLRRAITCSEQAIAAAEAAGDVASLAHAYKVLGWVQLDRGDLETTTTLERSLALYEQVDDRAGQASVLNMIGGFAYWRGEWDEALHRYEQARELARQTGNMVLGAFCTTNIGEIALDRGEIETATALFQEAARVWRVAGDRPGMAFATLLLGRAVAGSGRFAEAQRLLEQARDEALGVGSQVDALEAMARLAECLLAAGEFDEALAVVDVTLAEAAMLGGVAAQTPLLLRVRGLALELLGRHDEARAALRESLSAAHARHAGYEIALTIGALAGLSDDADERQRMTGESVAMLERLGVGRAIEE